MSFRCGHWLWFLIAATGCGTGGEFDLSNSSQPATYLEETMPPPRVEVTLPLAGTSTGRRVTQWIHCNRPTCDVWLEAELDNLDRSTTEEGQQKPGSISWWHEDELPRYQPVTISMKPPATRSRRELLWSYIGDPPHRESLVSRAVRSPSLIEWTVHSPRRHKLLLRLTLPTGTHGFAYKKEWTYEDAITFTHRVAGDARFDSVTLHELREQETASVAVSFARDQTRNFDLRWTPNQNPFPLASATTLPLLGAIRSRTLTGNEWKQVAAHLDGPCQLGDADSVENPTRVGDSETEDVEHTGFCNGSQQYRYRLRTPAGKHSITLYASQRTRTATLRWSPPRGTDQPNR